MTPVRSIPSDFDPAIVAAIERRLRRLEAEHNVTIVWAVESGSRAWGFPSPDSDYDCRFIFIRPLVDYLSIHPKRDVIEVPIEEGLDINGWDLFKLARLLLKGNAVAIEWLMSPIIYGGFDEFRADWCAEAGRLVHRSALIQHYYHLGQGQFRKHLAEPDAVILKKIFYALRPAVVLRWLRMHPDRTVAPMHFPTLLAQTDLPAATREEITNLLAQKARTREMGLGPLPEPISGFIHSEYAQAHSALLSGDQSASPVLDRVAGADRLVRQWVRLCETFQTSRGGA